MAFRNNCEQPKSRHFITIQVVGNCHKWKRGRLQALSCRQCKHPRCPARLCLAARRLLNTCIPMGRVFLGFLPTQLLSEPQIYQIWHQPITAGWLPSSSATEVFTSLPHSTAASQNSLGVTPLRDSCTVPCNFHSSITNLATFSVFLD